MRILAITLLTLGVSAAAEAAWYVTAVVPEIDPSHAAGTLALISGAFLVMKNARRK